jgi:hypothetical protein
MPNGLIFQLSGDYPMPPPDADFSFTIDFEKGAGVDSDLFRPGIPT